MKLIGIDPGNIQSAYCWYDTERGRPLEFLTCLNSEFHNMVTSLNVQHVVIEQIASYGMPVGETIFETCVWTGRLIEFFEMTACRTVSRIPRKDVKLHLCNSPKANDATIKQALKDRFGEKGTKKSKGILYGIKKDEWSALAVAVTYADLNISHK